MAEQQAGVPRWVGQLGYYVSVAVFVAFMGVFAPVMYVGESHRRGHWLSREEFAHLKHIDDTDGDDNGQGTPAQDALDAAAYSEL